MTRRPKRTPRTSPGPQSASLPEGAGAQEPALMPPSGAPAAAAAAASVRAGRPATPGLPLPDARGAGDQGLPEDEASVSGQDSDIDLSGLAGLDLSDMEDGAETLRLGTDAPLDGADAEPDELAEAGLLDEEPEPDGAGLPPSLPPPTGARRRRRTFAGARHGTALGRSGPRIIAIGGAKGGSGRSIIAVNVGVHLAQVGKRVLLVDADFSAANLHTLLGLAPPAKTLSDIFLRKKDSLEEVIIDTDVPGLSLVSGLGENMGVGPSRGEGRNRLLECLVQLDQDYVIIDLPAGLSPTVLDLFLFADCGVVVIAPEPTSVENAYRFIKSAFFRHIWNQEPYKSLRGLLTDAQGTVREFGILSPPAFLEQVWKRFPDLAPALTDELAAFRPQIVMNQCRTRADTELGEAVCTAVRRKMQVQLGFLGAVEHDDSIWLAVRKRRPVVLEFPEGKPAENFQQIVRRLLALELGLRGRH